MGRQEEWLYYEVREIQFTPDGTRLAYVAIIDNESYVICGEWKSKPYELAGYLAFS